MDLLNGKTTIHVVCRIYGNIYLCSYCDLETKNKTIFSQPSSCCDMPKTSIMFRLDQYTTIFVKTHFFGVKIVESFSPCFVR